ncbi:heparinase II/III domain-containing protein [Bifidobacterium avesanii]|uniref:Heparinase II/III-like C-terminal domain-containing protein n=1 Tax=Bifidobacterium avesanii TaxID=1798157 RepID=A0A7K3TF44_9BIFI|nr:heparinase II/III family protein [Bifidobacterium avesanii]KAB8294458.1 heparinase [Bifidobacterium avesanii]NEG77711.1 hypothetical protein [Bifidobacterium avesanii]
MTGIGEAFEAIPGTASGAADGGAASGNADRTVGGAASGIAGDAIGEDGTIGNGTSTNNAMDGTMGNGTPMDNTTSNATGAEPHVPGAPCADAWREAGHALPFQPFNPFPPASDHEAWRALPRELADLYRRRAAAHRERPWPQLLAHDWARFFRDGDRHDYEVRYGEIRRRVADDLMAYGVARASETDGERDVDRTGGTADGERAPRESAPYESAAHQSASHESPSRAFLEDAIDGVMLLCDEAAWQIPAHNAYVRDAPQLPWPDPDRPILDLFACETGQLLASALHILGGDLPEPVRRRIMNELDRRIVAPYLNDTFWWMGEDGEPTNNWTVWCTQNVLAAAFLAPVADGVRRRIVDKAVRGLDAFLAGYGEDGCCEEGAGYYHSAGLCLFGALRILADVRPDAFARLWREPKIANIATYIVRMRIRENLYFNFSDCSTHTGLMSAREFLFARAVGAGGMARIAAAEWRHGLALPDGDDTMLRINALYLMLEARAAGEMLANAGNAANPGPVPETGETFFPSTGIAVMRGGGFDVGVKAGRNGASHSHNDTGNVIVYRGGRPVLVDAGVGAYTRQTFSPERYELWPMQSSWHNLPDFDGVMQRETPDCRAEGVRVSFGELRSIAAADLTHAWPAEAGLRDYRRSITLDKRAGTLAIHDEASGTFTTATLHLMTAEEPLPIGDNAGDADAAAFRVGETTLEIRRSGGPAGSPCAIGPVSVEPKPLDDAKLRGEWRSDRLWRINVPFAAGGSGTVDVTVR